MTTVFSLPGQLTAVTVDTVIPTYLRPLHTLPLFSARQLVRTESVPCDINNPLRYTDLHISQTLPKTNKINKVGSSPAKPAPEKPHNASLFKPTHTPWKA